MSFKDLLSKVVKPLITTQSNPDTIEQVITDLYDLTHTNGQRESVVSGEAEPEKPKRTYTRRKASNTAQSKVSILEVADWLCIPECAKAVGRSKSDITRLISAGHIHSIEWAKRFPCVHRRQVAMWFERGETLDLSDCLDVAERWSTMSGISIELGLSMGAVYGAVEKGAIASHRAGKKCRLVNIAECETYFGGG